MHPFVATIRFSFNLSTKSYPIGMLGLINIDDTNRKLIYYYLKILDGTYKKDITNNSYSYNLNNKIVVPVGGGKDSIVTIELLKQLGKEINCCSVNTATAIENTMKIANIPNFQIKRIILKNINL